jgi:hypothetical protein
MSHFEVTGGCLCGAVRFRVTAKPLAAYYCHCTMCQRNGGGSFMVGATVPIESFAFTKGEPKAYESSPGFVRLSCVRCGSALGMQAKNDPKLADFSLGCLDDPNAIRPEFHQFTSTQARWCEIADGLPRFAGGAPELSKTWTELDGWTALD